MSTQGHLYHIFNADMSEKAVLLQLGKPEQLEKLVLALFQIANAEPGKSKPLLVKDDSGDSFYCNLIRNAVLKDIGIDFVEMRFQQAVKRMQEWKRP